MLLYKDRMGVIVDIWELKRFNYLWPTKDDTVLFRNVTLDEYEENIRDTPVQYSIFVHVLNNSPEETRWVMKLADHYTFIKGIVSGLDLMDSKLDDTIMELKKDSRFVGCRHILDFEDTDWLQNEEVHRGLQTLEKHGLTFDLLLRPHLLHHGPVLAAKFPRLKFVVDHIAKPHIKEGKIDEWKQGMAEIAKYSNMFCKISGMVNEAEWGKWKLEDFTPYVQHILDVFGAERCLYGSDWPVCTQAVADYKKQLQLTTDILNQLGISPEQKEMIFCKNAIQIYGLKI